MLERFDLKNLKPVSTPLAGHFMLSKRLCPSTEKEKGEVSVIPYSLVVGSQMYAMVCTRLDISHVVGVVRKFLANPGKEHWEVAKWIFRYLRVTSKACLRFGGSESFDYTDSDMAEDLDCRKSTSRYLFTFVGGAISWQSKLQKCFTIFYRSRVYCSY